MLRPEIGLRVWAVTMSATTKSRRNATRLAMGMLPDIQKTNVTEVAGFFTDRKFNWDREKKT
jgi:hypothetical protein